MLTKESRSLEPVIFMGAKDILDWDPSSVNPLMVSNVPVAARLTPSVPRFVAGLDNGEWSYSPDFDKYPQGGSSGSVYNFQYWQYIDSIYYYMHNLAAVPPVVWTNAAHRNGVKMCAAVTADFAGGGDEFNTLFNDNNWKRAADQLFAIVNSYRFDGWMIDVENGADPNQNVRNAMAALRARTLWNGQKVEVGYYEAGKQSIDDANTLAMFLSGSFFQSDYASWVGNFPEQTYNYLRANGQGDKIFDTYWSVYTNSFSSDDKPANGLYNGCVYLDLTLFFKQLALAKMAPPATGYYQSLGIYAPDWTMYGGLHENPQRCKLPTRDVFQRTERLFWQGMAIGADGKLVTSSPCVADSMQPRTTLVAPTLLTRFNTGQGSSFFLRGKNAAARAWNYLSGQDLLPTWIAQSGSPQPTVTADYTYDDAYDGGSSLAFTGTLPVGQSVEYSLFLAGMQVQSPIVAQFTYKARNANSLLPYLRIIYAGGSPAVVEPTSGTGWVRVGQQLTPPPGTIIREIRAGFFNNTPSPAVIDVLLGELALLASGVVPPPSLINVKAVDNLLTWEPPSGFFTAWYYNVFAVTASGPTFVGRTFVPGYDLTVPLFAVQGVIDDKYIIQPVNSRGQASPLSSEE
jgi:hypothetical protein